MTKEELIEQYRDINIDDCQHWAECVIDDFVVKMRNMGVPISAEDISSSYSWWCQGDGSSFVSPNIIGDDFDTFCRTNGIYLGASGNILLTAYEAGCEPFIHMWRFSSRYSHECTVAAEVRCNNTFTDLLDPDECDETSVRWHAAKELDRLAYLHFDSEMDTSITNILRDYMKELHKKLEEEYEALTDDDAVWDAICEYGYDEELDEEEL